MMNEQAILQTVDAMAALLRLTQDIGAALLRLRQEHDVLIHVVKHLIRAFALRAGAVYLHNGQTCALVAQAGALEEAPAALAAVDAVVNQYIRDGAGDVQVLTRQDVALTRLLDAGGAECLSDVQTLALVPLATHSAPMGVIVLLNTEAARLAPIELETLRLIGQILAGRLREIRLQARLDAQARQLAAQSERFDPNSTADPLTGLAHRQRFMDSVHHDVAETVQTGGSLSLLILRVDYFQEITRQSATGLSDEVLARVAQEIQGRIRSRDMAARFLGEEFWVLLPATPGLGAVVAAERLRARIAAMTFATADTTWRLTVSIGVASLSVHNTSPDQLITKATGCLEQAQHLGGNQIIFDWEEALTTIKAA